MKKILNHIFIDGLSGMALGLFSTLIIGTIIGQIGTLVGNEIGTYLIAVSSVAKTVTACNSFSCGSRYDRSVSGTGNGKFCIGKSRRASGSFCGSSDRH